jgi:hypothetical protein
MFQGFSQLSFWVCWSFLLKLLGVFGCPELGALKFLLLPLFVIFWSFSFSYFTNCVYSIWVHGHLLSKRASQYKVWWCGYQQAWKLDFVKRGVVGDGGNSWWRSTTWIRSTLEVVINLIHHQCEFLGSFSSHNKIMGLVCVEQ